MSKEDINLPKTSFSMKANLPNNEPEILKIWEKMDLFKKLRESRKGKEKFVLHDGPPYANGHIHMGTALNKILKDIVTKFHQMDGKDSVYVPGWDCHGLPIEWKIEEQYKKNKKNKIEDINRESVKRILAKKKIPEFSAGDTIKVGVRIVEGKRERIQYFEGVCIAKKNRNINSSFTVRKISFGEGVERTFALYSPIVGSIKVIRSGKVKRAKLYYLRDRKGKSARIAEKIKKKIGINVSGQVSENKSQEQEKIIVTATEPKKEESQKAISKPDTKKKS